MQPNLHIPIYFCGIALVAMAPLSALTIRDYRKLSRDDRATFVSAAVSMLAYSYAANGDVPRATCAKVFFFGQHGEDTPGPKELALQIGIAEQRDPDRFLVEGVILGTVEKACPDSAKSKQ